MQVVLVALTCRQHSHLYFVVQVDFLVLKIRWQASISAVSTQEISWTLALRLRVIRYKIHAVENRADSNAAQGMVPGETVPQTSRCPTLMQPWRGCPR